jgi:uncharacterized protein YyaL (SSP411 family)
VLADWNGLVIAALANAGALLGETDWVLHAARAFHFVAESMTNNDRLGHSWRAGRLVFPGISSDYAAMIRAAIALHQATGTQLYLDRAIRWTAMLERHHAGKDNGAYFLTADDAEGLIVRPASSRDNALPNPNAVHIQNLIRLSLLAGDDNYRRRADSLLETLLPFAAESVFDHIALLSALDLRLRHAEIVAVGKRANALAEAALRAPFLNRTVLRAANAQALPKTHPAHVKLATAPSEGAVFVCQGESCSLPIADPVELSQMLSGPRN